MRRTRWRTPSSREVADVERRLASWPCDVGGAVRHMFPLSAIEAFGGRSLRVAEGSDAWAAAVVFPGRLVVPCGDAAAVRAAGQPGKRWRLLVGDAAPSEALLEHLGDDPALRVHEQRFMTLDHDRVPSASEIPDPGLRRAATEDIDRLAELAVQLHVDDEFGPDPGRAGLRGYRRRLEETVRQGVVYCVGPPGAPVCKLERSVSSDRWGVQLAGIVVAPERRSAGLGRQVVATAVRQALEEGPPDRPVTLHVRAANEAARRVYRAAGFVDREEWRLAVRA